MYLQQIKMSPCWQTIGYTCSIGALQYLLGRYMCIATRDSPSIQLPCWRPWEVKSVIQCNDCIQCFLSFGLIARHLPIYTMSDLYRSFCSTLLATYYRRCHQGKCQLWFYILSEMKYLFDRTVEKVERYYNVKTVTKGTTYNWLYVQDKIPWKSPECEGRLKARVVSM